MPKRRDLLIVAALFLIIGWIVPASLFIQAAVSLILAAILMRYLVEPCHSSLPW
jgi:hypothetical protein